MIDNIETSRIEDILNSSSLSQHNPPKIHCSNDINATLQVDYEYFINKATQIPPTSDDAVKRARNLMSTDWFNDAAHIQVAAENIVKDGS
jgi:hypothetical protein